MARTELLNQKDVNATTNSLPTQEPNLGIYNFIDESGNLTEIKKKKRKNSPVPTEANLEELVAEPTVIGVSDTIPMGCGDLNSGTEMAFAIY